MRIHYTTPNNSGTPGPVGPQGPPGSDAPTDRIYSGEFETVIDSSGTTTFDGNAVPSSHNQFTLGTEAVRWADIFLGPGSIIIADETVGLEDKVLSVKNGYVYVRDTEAGAAGFDLGPFVIAPTGIVTINSDEVIDPTKSLVNINATVSNTTYPRTFAGTLLQLTAQDGESAHLVLDSFGTGDSPVITGRAGRGTVESPTAIKANDTLMRITSHGFGATEFKESLTRIDATATEDFTNTAAGTKFNFWLTENGTVVTKKIVEISQNGVILKQGGIIFQDNTTQSTAAVAQVQSDWTQTSNTSADYIKNKPTLPDLSGYGVPVSYNPVWSATGLIYTGTPATGSYMRMGKMVTFRIKVLCSNVTNFGTGQYSLTLPFAPVTNYRFRDGEFYHANGPVPEYYQMSANAVANSTTITLWYTASQGADAEMDHNSPHVIETPDHLFISGTYECI